MNTMRSRVCGTDNSATSGSMRSQLHRQRETLGGFYGRAQLVLLIDEIDKADIDFRTTCCSNSTACSSSCMRPAKRRVAQTRPVVVITSNNEKELPDAFLRRCFFHYIRFPDAETMERIVQVHFPDLKKDMLRVALSSFFEVREVPGLKKKPSTSGCWIGSSFWSLKISRRKPSRSRIRRTSFRRFMALF